MLWVIRFPCWLSFSEFTKFYVYWPSRRIHSDRLSFSVQHNFEWNIIQIVAVGPSRYKFSDVFALNSTGSQTPRHHQLYISFSNATVDIRKHQGKAIVTSINWIGDPFRIIWCRRYFTERVSFSCRSNVWRWWAQKWCRNDRHYSFNFCFQPFDVAMEKTFRFLGIFRGLFLFSLSPSNKLIQTLITQPKTIPLRWRYIS